MPMPNNVILKDHKIAAFCVTKAANTSIKVAILDALGKPTDRPHAKGVLKYAGKRKILGFKGWFTFAIVRNPYDRMVSLWADKCRDTQHKIFKDRDIGPFDKFSDFVEAICKIKDFDIHWVSQHALIVCGGQIVPLMVGRYERLHQDWVRIRHICRGYGLDLPALPKENASNHESWESYYTTKTRDMIYKLYQKDFETFGYER